MLDKNTPDHDLWEAICMDDYQAFVLLYQRYWKRVYKAAYNRIRSADRCEEIVHDVFLILWKKRGTLQIQHFERYLNAIARYEVFRHIKATKLSIVDYTDEELPDAPELAYNLGELKLEETDLEHSLKSYLVDLPKRCQQIFLMSKIQQLSNEEIAKELGIHKHTVENQLAYAMKHLRATLKGASVLTLLVSIFLER